jgi:hypothetical protein
LALSISTRPRLLATVSGMRHISTLLAAVFVAPLSWLLLAFGQDRSAQAFADAQHNGAFDTGDFVRPVACLAAAGLLLGLLATLRFSPLGATVTGAVYAAGYLALLFDPDGVLGLFPRSLSVAGRSADPTTPLRTGTAMVLGGLMLVATFSVGRWRRRPSAGEPEEQGTVEPAPDRLVGAEGLGLIPSAGVAEPEQVTRYTSAPRHPGNRGPSSTWPGDNTTDRWQRTRESAWPDT